MSDYALTISDAEIRRYLFMAERARELEADLWSMAGIAATEPPSPTSGAGRRRRQQCSQRRSGRTVT